MHYSFDSLPETLSDLKALPQAALKTPEDTAALVILALAEYPKNSAESIEMLSFLKGPGGPLSEYEKQFLRDRFMDHGYIMNSYFAGSSPENNYTPAKPYSFDITEPVHGRDQIAEGYIRVSVKSSGADTEREIKLRTKASTGEWFLYEQFLLPGIRVPKAQDPWA